MTAYEVVELLAQQQTAGVPYVEFLRVPALSAGLYVLPAGAEDLQQPHREDEVYVVVSGRATIDVAGDERPVTAGSVIYVAAGVAHHFHSIVEELVVLVLFAPAET